MSAIITGADPDVYLCLAILPCPLNELLLQQERGAQRTACRGRLLIYYYAAGIYASTRLRRRSSRTMLILRNQEVIEDAVLLCLMMTLLSSLFPAHILFLDTYSTEIGGCTAMTPQLRCE